MNKKTENKILCHLPGGDLEIEFLENVFMTGPAELVFEGQISSITR